MTNLSPLTNKISELLKSKETVVVGIDGNSASGKTTAALYLQTLYDCNLIHMDDFFLPFDMRTKERYAEAGGNIHYERFMLEIVNGIKSKKDYSYRVFDCSAGDYSQTRTNSPKRLTLIEGAYCLHPDFEEIYDLKVFFSITPQEQKKRIISRNGEEAFSRFESTWIPMENKYINQFKIPEKCDIIMTS